MINFFHKKHKKFPACTGNQAQQLKSTVHIQHLGQDRDRMLTML